MKTVSNTARAIGLILFLLMVIWAFSCAISRETLCYDRNLYEYRVENFYMEPDTIEIRDCGCEIAGRSLGMYIDCEHRSYGPYFKISLLRSTSFPVN